MLHQRVSFELPNLCLEFKFEYGTIGTYDVTFMVGTTCDLFRRQFCWKVFAIRLQYRTFKETLKIRRHHPFKLDFGFTTTCIMIVYENIMKSGTD